MIDIKTGSGRLRQLVSAGGTIALMDQAVASATNFLTGVIIGRACAEQEFGLYMLGLSIVLLAMRLQVSLISTPYMVYSPRLENGARARYTGSTLLHQIGFTAVTVVVLIPTGLLFSSGVGPEGISSVVWALVLTLGFILLREYVRNICFSHLNFATAMVLDVGAAALQMAGLLFLAFSGQLSVVAAFIVIGGANGIAVAVWFLLMRGSFSIKFEEVLPDLAQNWNFGKWIFASGFLWETSVYLYPWILTYFHGTASTGVWAACFGAVSVGNPLLLGMSNFLGPKIMHAFANGGRRDLRSFVSKSCRRFFLLVLPLAMILVVFGGQIVTLLYGDKYEGQGLIVGLLAIDLLTAPARFSLSRALFALERAGLDFVTNFVPLLVLIAAGVWLVRAHGILGVAAGLLLGNTAVTVVKFFAYELVTRSDSRQAAES